MPDADAAKYEIKKMPNRMKEFSSPSNLALDPRDEKVIIKFKNE